METKSLSRQRDFSYYINPYTNLKANEASGPLVKLEPKERVRFYLVILLKICLIVGALCAAPHAAPTPPPHG